MTNEIVWLRGLRPARIRAGMTLQAVADAMGVTRQAINQWETGVRWPAPDKMPQLAEVLSCTIDELYGRAGETEEAWKKSN